MENMNASQLELPELFEYVLNSKYPNSNRDIITKTAKAEKAYKQYDVLFKKSGYKGHNAFMNNPKNPLTIAFYNKNPNTFIEKSEAGYWHLLYAFILGVVSSNFAKQELLKFL